MAGEATRTFCDELIIASSRAGIGEDEVSGGSGDEVRESREADCVKLIGSYFCRADAPKAYRICLSWSFAHEANVGGQSRGNGGKGGEGEDAEVANCAAHLATFLPPNASKQDDLTRALYSDRSRRRDKKLLSIFFFAAASSGSSAALSWIRILFRSPSLQRRRSSSQSRAVRRNRTR